MNKLKNKIGYLAGPIDRCPNLGIEWRRRMTWDLCNRYEAVAYDPMNKPIDIAGEMEGRELRKQWKTNAEYEKLADFIRKIRHVDLRMIDKADFGIFYVDTDIHMCGTYEELVTMNRAKKPCLIVCKQGVAGIPDWIFGMTPVATMFNDWDEMFQYLDKIDSGWDDGTNRWLHFSY